MSAIVEELRQRAEWRSVNEGPFTKQNLVEWRAADTITSLKEDRDSWRRVAERLETEKQALRVALETADEALDRITQHHPKTPGLQFTTHEGLLESAVGIASMAREPAARALSNTGDAG